MRALVSTIVATLVLVALAPSAQALNDTDVAVTNNAAVTQSVCWLEIPRPDDPTGDPRSPTNCACVLVGPDTVLTNSACVSLNVEESDPPLVAGIEVRFQSGDDTLPVFGVTDIELFRFYDPLTGSVDGLAGAGFTEFALLRLDAVPGPGDAVPAILNTEPLANLQGQNVQIVGYGAEAMGQQFPALLQGIEVAARSVQFTHFLAGTEDATTCRYDEGAPVFADFDGEWRLVAITANDLLDRCFNNLPRMRVDRFAESFIIPYVARTQVAGNCGADDVCEQGCAYQDVDCDTCDFQGGGADDCDASCSPRDFDCELGSLPGNECTDDSDCEFGGSCVAADDDTTFNYCSVSCDSAGIVGPTSCPNQMMCVSGSGGEECKYGVPSRGSQGFTCSDNADCRSDICEGGICVFECNGTCPAGTECLPSSVASGVNVCRAAGDAGGGGFCAVGGNSGAPFGLILFGVVLGAGLIRRRRG